MSTRTARFAAFLVLFVLPLALRLAPLTHGDERNYVPDTHMVRAALGMARDHDLVPPVGKYSYYPNLLPYLLLPIYGVQFLLGVATHAWGSIKEFGDHMLAHPQHAAWPARALVALFGALTTWVVYRGARAAGLKQGAWVAAWLVATGLLNVQLSTHERPWAPLVFFMAASAWAAIEYARTASPRVLALSGAMAGLAYATHQGGAGALAIPGLAWLCGPLAWRGPALKLRLVHGVAAVALFALLGVLIGHPYLLRYGRTRADQIIGGEQLAEAGGFALGGVSFVPAIRLDSAARLSKALLGYDPVVLVLGLAGVWLALRDRRLRAVAIFTLVWGAIFLTQHSDHVRYLLPLTVFLAWPAGLVAERWLKHPSGGPALALLLAFPLVQALRHDWLLSQPDTRAEAEMRLAAMPTGSRTAIDRYGPEVDFDKASLYALERLRNSKHESLRSREMYRKQQLESAAIPDGGVSAVRVEELFELNARTHVLEVRKGLESLGKDPDEVFRALGITHFLHVDRRPRVSEDDWLFGHIAPGALVWKIDPSCGEDSASEAFLPTEMDFPLTGLWQVDRPGPLLELRAR
jgi:hypothetical protein